MGKVVKKLVDPTSVFVNPLRAISPKLDPLGNSISKLTKKPGDPGPTDAQLALEAQQREASARLDAEENRRRKRLLAASQGIRAFRGSALMRPAAGNSSGTAPAAAVVGRGTGIGIGIMPGGPGGGYGGRAGGRYVLP